MYPNCLLLKIFSVNATLANILFSRYWWKHIWYWIGDMLLVLIFCQLRHQHLSGVWTLTRTTQASPTEDQHRQYLHISSTKFNQQQGRQKKTMKVAKMISITATYLEPAFLLNDKKCTFSMRTQLYSTMKLQNKTFLVDTVWMLHVKLGESFPYLKPLLLWFPPTFPITQTAGVEHIFSFLNNFEAFLL